jgi:hypothetical protein
VAGSGHRRPAAVGRQELLGALTAIFRRCRRCLLATSSQYMKIEQRGGIEDRNPTRPRPEEDASEDFMMIGRIDPLDERRRLVGVRQLEEERHRQITVQAIEP